MSHTELAFMNKHDHPFKLCDALFTYLHTALRCYVDNKNVTVSPPSNVVTYTYTSSDGVTTRYPAGFASCLNLPLSGSLINSTIALYLTGSSTSAISGRCTDEGAIGIILILVKVYFNLK